MKVHPIAELFPLLEGAAFDALVADIKEHGQREPIVIFDDRILDGRNRWRACKAARVEPKTKLFRGTEEDALFATLSLNLHRRHLDESQRARVAVEVERMLAKETAKNVGGRPKKGEEKTGGKSATSFSDSAKARGKAAEALNVSPRLVQDAKKVATKGVSELDDALKRGLIPATTAAKVADKPVEEQRAIVAKVEAGAKPADALRDVKRETVKAQLEDVAAVEAKAAAGVYDVVVLDPPWAMEKIERDERPNQVEFDYPTMSEDELRALEVPCADDCHVWVWTTHKFLPMALRLLDAWGLKYVCAFVWHKPGGFQPIGLPQYNCEFAIYARKGSPSFLDTKAFNTCFEAPRGKHSEKPEDFYALLRRVTAGRRLDMFNRRNIDGFDGWGKETSHAAE